VAAETFDFDLTTFIFEKTTASDERVNPEGFNPAQG
jgi:hypothetical protein